MFKDSDKWVIEGNVQDNLMCVATFQRRRLENVSLRVEVFLPKKRSKVWRRFEVSIDALRFGCERGKLFNVEDLKTFLVREEVFYLKKRFRQKADMRRSDDALRFLSTLWGFYRGFEVSINALRFCCVRGKLFNVEDLKTFLWGWRFFFQRNAQRSGDALRFLSTLWGFYQRFYVSIDALRFCCAW